MQIGDDQAPLIEQVKDIQRLKAILLMHDKVVVHFAASWSEASQTFQPIFQTFAEIHMDIKFISIDADEHEELAQEYDIASLPSFVLIHKGKVVDKQQGTDAEFLDSRIVAHFS